MTVSSTALGSREECIAYMPLAHIHELLLETMMVRGCPPSPASRCLSVCVLLLHGERAPATLLRSVKTNRWAC